MCLEFSFLFEVTLEVNRGSVLLWPKGLNGPVPLVFNKVSSYQSGN
jgi:hypothetical protein